MYLRKNKEVFDAELYAIADVLDIILVDGQRGIDRPSKEVAPRWTRVHIWTDFYTTIWQLQHTAPALRQWVARAIISRMQQLQSEEWRSRSTGFLETSGSGAMSRQIGQQNRRQGAQP